MKLKAVLQLVQEFLLDLLHLRYRTIHYSNVLLLHPLKVYPELLN